MISISLNGLDKDQAIKIMSFISLDSNGKIVVNESTANVITTGNSRVIKKSKDSKPAPQEPKKAKTEEPNTGTEADQSAAESDPDWDEFTEKVESQKSLDDVINTFQEFVKNFKPDAKAGRLAAKKILNKHKVASVQDLKPEQFESVLKDLNKK